MDYCPINVFRDGEPQEGDWPAEWERKPDRRPCIQLDASDPDHAAMLSMVASADADLVRVLEDTRLMSEHFKKGGRR